MGRYLLVSGDFVKTGGMDRANHALAAYLAGRGDEVHIVAFRIAPDLAAMPNVVHHRVPKPLNSYFLSGPLFSFAGRAEAKRLAGKGARVVVNGGNCDWDDVNWVHHVNSADSPLTGGSPIRRLKTRLAYRRHVADERKIVPKAKLIVTSCEKTRSDLLRLIGGDPSRTFAVHYGVDAETFRAAEPGEREAAREALGWAQDRPKVAFVGALGDRRKGFDQLFAAWVELCRDPAWDADLVVAGRGAEVPAWTRRAEEAGLSDRISFLGFVSDRAAMASLYRACDAHCLPSRYEGYSLVTQEALASGIPAFVTLASGIAERYPEALRDLLIPDPEDLADLVRRLRDWRSRMAEYREAIGPLSRTIRETTWEVMAGRIAALIDA